MGRTAKEQVLSSALATVACAVSCFKPPAGRLRFKVNDWMSITSDPHIISAIRGYHLDFYSKPMQLCEPPQIVFNDTELSFLMYEISRLLEKGVIVPCNVDLNQFVSTVFLRPKKNGTYRLILNLKQLNQDIVYQHFKMDSLQSCINLMTSNCYMASLDLTDAYYSVPIAKCCQKYLRFRIGQQLYQFTCLPNGLSSAPRLFTKLMKPVFSFLRQKGFISSGYLDDSFLVGHSFDVCMNNIITTSDLFTRLGFDINTDKSVTTPTQQIVHLGFVLDSVTMTVNIGSKKIDKVKTEGQKLLLQKRMCIRNVASFIGTLVSCFPGVAYGPLYYRDLERNKTEALRDARGDYGSDMTLSVNSRTEIEWWIHNAGKHPVHINRGPHSIILQTDASSSGWGARILHGASTGGRWSQNEIHWHINVLELKAVHLALLALCKFESNNHVQIQSDNTTAVSYIREMGGSHSVQCNAIAREIWTWCRVKNIWLTATHIPGSLNWGADRESRTFNDRTEWQLSSTIFDMCIKRWGKPEVDMFASRLNHQFKPYVSWRPDPEACAVDAFSQNWHNKFLYLFPPFSVLGRVVQKIREEGAKAILIAPHWTTQTWFPAMMQMLQRPPLVFPKSKTLLTLPGSEGKVHPLLPKMQLAAFLLSGNI